jgi:hypothetical protein
MEQRSAGRIASREVTTEWIRSDQRELKSESPNECEDREEPSYSAGYLLSLDLLFIIGVFSSRYISKDK